jgi:hypothetical protein
MKIKLYTVKAVLTVRENLITYGRRVGYRRVQVWLPSGSSCFTLDDGRLNGRCASMVFRYHFATVNGSWKTLV